MVLVPAKRASSIHRHDLVNAITEDETPIEHGDARLVGWEEFAVEIDDGRIRHGTHPIT